MTDFLVFKEAIARGVEIAGVLVILTGAIIATIAFIGALAREAESAYRQYRRNLGRAILLGLELLVAADIIQTVAVRPAVEDVMVLAAIVLIRTFLSFSLEIEITGSLPWRRSENQVHADGSRP